MFSLHLNRDSKDQGYVCIAFFVFAVTSGSVNMWLTT